MRQVKKSVKLSRPENNHTSFKNIMEYYHGLITKKSFDFLKEFNRKFDFILIGGWAVWLYCRALKSKDIDIIIGYDGLGKMKDSYDVYKNDRLKKYEIKTGEFDIDIYLDHYSSLGAPIAAVAKDHAVKNGFKVPRLEALLLLKLFAWKNRRGSVKGMKDELDIFGLAILPEFDWEEYMRMVKAWRLGSYHREFVGLLKARTSVKALGINEQKMAKAKKYIFSQI